MSTISDAGIIKEMLKNDGIYPGDPQMDEIWQYESSWGNICYKLIYGGMNSAEALDSPFVLHPILLWDKLCGLSAEGKALLKEESDE